MSGVLILGANSDIAKAIAREYAKHKRKLVLASRNVDALNAFVSEYNLPAEVHFFDAEKSDSFEAFLKDIKTDYDTAVCAFGYLPDIESQLQPIEIEKSIAVNYSGAVKILSLISKQFKQQESGLIIGISSVAGDRGKQSTMIYGSAKAGFTSFLDGLRNSLYQSGVHVLTVKPGYVNTK